MDKNNLFNEINLLMDCKAQSRSDLISLKNKNIIKNATIIENKQIRRR
ncbi:hypothetical protein AB0Y04_00340 [Loigolactobacillus coryniformis]